MIGFDANLPVCASMSGNPGRRRTRSSKIRQRRPRCGRGSFEPQGCRVSRPSGLFDGQRMTRVGHSPSPPPSPSLPDLRAALPPVDLKSYRMSSGVLALSTVTVSDKGQVVLPASIRHRLGIEPGTKLDFELEGDTIRVRPLRAVARPRTEDGFGILKCDRPGERRLADFDVATAMRNTDDDRT
jgi:antitoxin PrlF